MHVILGGSLKGEPFEPLVRAVSERCVACYLIGEAADEPRDRAGAGRAAGVELRRCGGMEDAVAAAAKAAAPGQVVLLAPACASFDAYQRLRAARRALPRPRRGAAMRRRAPRRGRRARRRRPGRRRPDRRRPRARGARRARGDARAIEYSLLLTATLCLLAFGVGDGLQRQLDDLAARRRRRRRLLPQADAALRRPRAASRCASCRCAACSSLAPHAAAARRSRSSCWSPCSRPGSASSQRRQPLDRRRPVPGPALRDREGGADPLRRPPAGRAAEAGARYHGSMPVSARRRPCLC